MAFWGIFHNVTFQNVFLSKRATGGYLVSLVKLDILNNILFGNICHKNLSLSFTSFSFMHTKDFDLHIFVSRDRINKYKTFERFALNFDVINILYFHLRVILRVLKVSLAGNRLNATSKRNANHKTSIHFRLKIFVYRN